jgi:hypothetical protein
VDEEMKEDLRAEKERGIQMKEQLKMIDSEKMRIQDRLLLIGNGFEACQIESRGAQAAMDDKDRQYHDYNDEFQMVFNRLKDADVELEELHLNTRELELKIGMLREDLHKVEVERSDA